MILMELYNLQALDEPIINGCKPQASKNGLKYIRQETNFM